MRFNNQAGVALITVLLVVALVSISASAALWEQHLDIRRSTNVLYKEQAIYYHLGAETWAKQVLKVNFSPLQRHQLTQSGQLSLPATPIEGGSIRASLIDVQARYNLNNLLDDEGKASAPDIAYLQRLLQRLDLPPEWVMRLVDWIDKDQLVSLPNGAEDDEYSRQQPPYRSANQKLQSLSELFLILPLTRLQYQRLTKLVCVLPYRTQINLNSADATLLLALHADIDQYTVDKILQQRLQTPYANVGKLAEQFQQSAIKDMLGFLTVSSHFF